MTISTVSSLNLVNVWICIDVSEFIILMLTKDTSSITESIAAAIVDFNHVCIVRREDCCCCLIEKEKFNQIHISQTSVLLNWI